MKNPQLILAFFWPLKLIKTLFTYFNDKIKPKPSPDGTLSPNTILFSDGRYCTVLSEECQGCPYKFNNNQNLNMKVVCTSSCIVACIVTCISEMIPFF